MAAGVCDSFSSLFAADVTCTFIRSSRLSSVKSRSLLCAPHSESANSATSVTTKAPSRCLKRIPELIAAFLPCAFGRDTVQLHSSVSARSPRPPMPGQLHAKIPAILRDDVFHQRIAHRIGIALVEHVVETGRNFQGLHQPGAEQGEIHGRKAATQVS